MTARQNSSSAPSFYRDQTRFPAERPQLNGKALPPVSSSGAVSRVSRTTTSTTTSSSTQSARLGTRRAPESELITSFDPMKDMHLWTMWRVAVNGRIMDNVRKRNHAKPSGGDHVDNPFGQALVKTPLDRLIRVENGSHSLATLMMDPHGQGGGHLGIKQFVFYGVPRVVLKKPKNVIHLPQNDSE